MHTATLAFWIIVFDLLLLEILTFRLHSLLPLVGQTEYYSSVSVPVFRLCVFASAGNCVLCGGDTCLCVSCVATSTEMYLSPEIHLHFLFHFHS